MKTISLHVTHGIALFAANERVTLVIGSGGPDERDDL